MASTGQFVTNEQLTSSDLQNAVSLLATSFNNLVKQTMYNVPFVIINGLQVSASSTPDNGVQVATGLAFQSGQTVLLASQEGVNILPGSYPNGSGLAADATNPRIDVVYIEYTQGQANLQSRTIEPPGQTSYQQNVYTELVDSYTLSVVHGTPATSPVVPSAPVGSVVLAQVLVPANASTIIPADITDETTSYRNEGGRLALATNNLLTYKSATELGTPAGMKLDIGNTAYLFDNQTSGRLDIYGGTNGVSQKSPVLFTYSGTPVVIQPTSDATNGTHVWSARNASGVEYAWIDNTGNTSFTPPTATPTTAGIVKTTGTNGIAVTSDDLNVANGVATTDANNKVVQTANQSDKLSTARTISLNGDATGSAAFDGSANETITVTLANSGVVAGTYPKVTIDGKGRVTVGSSLASTDVTAALGFTPLSSAGQAADSAKLGGQLPSFYAPASSVPSVPEPYVSGWYTPDPTVAAPAANSTYKLFQLPNNGVGFKKILINSYVTRPWSGSSGPSSSEFEFYSNGQDLKSACTSTSANWTGIQQGDAGGNYERLATQNTNNNWGLCLGLDGMGAAPSASGILLITSDGYLAFYCANAYNPNTGADTYWSGTSYQFILM